MAKKIEVYVCDFCKRHYYDEVEAIECEEKHLDNARIKNISYENEIPVKPSVLSDYTVPIPLKVSIDFDYGSKYMVSAVYQYQELNNVKTK